MCIFIKSMAAWRLCGEAGKTRIHRRCSHWNRWVCVTLAIDFDTSHTIHNFIIMHVLCADSMEVCCSFACERVACLHCFTSQTIDILLVDSMAFSEFAKLMWHREWKLADDAPTTMRMKCITSTALQNTENTTKSHRTVFSSFMDSKIGSIKELWNKKMFMWKFVVAMKNRYLRPNLKSASEQACTQARVANVPTYSTRV